MKEENLEIFNNGIKFEIGKEKYGDGDPVNFWPSNTDVSNLLMGVVGASGSGKTQFTKSLIYQIISNGKKNQQTAPNILIFDYKKDFNGDKDDFPKSVNAKVYKPYELPINLFDISASKQTKPKLKRFNFLRDILKKIYGGIGNPQLKRLKDSILAAYTFAEQDGDEYPLFSDVLNQYQNRLGSPDNADTISSILESIVDEELFNNDREKLIPFSEFLNGVVVIDIGELAQDNATKDLLVIIFLNLFYENMLLREKKKFIKKDNHTLRHIDSMLIVDEANCIMKHEPAVLAEILEQSREFGAGVILSSQTFNHFKPSSSSDYKALITSWFIHNTPKTTLKDLQEFGLNNVNNETVNQIRKLGLHECFVKLNYPEKDEGKLIYGYPFYKICEDD